MKNLSGKTLIFYTFQQRKQLEYNVVAYQPAQQPILIKDVLEQLPISLSEGKYHFRFKSEFVQGNQKISGWIDISNLAAKVPLVAGSVYVKILKVKSNAHNKMFNLQKLAKVGLGQPSASKTSHSKSPHTVPQVANKIPNEVKPVAPISASKSTEQKVPVQKPVQAKKQEINLMQPPINRVSSQPSSKVEPAKSTAPKTESPSNGQADNGDLFSFQKPPVFVNNQTTEQKLDWFKKTMKVEQEQKQNALIARDQLQQKIKKWGYSGAKTINNLTTLLSTLHDIWPQWPEISLTQLMNPAKLATHTKKALIKTHPDKNREKPFRQKYLSKRVFQLINQAKKASST